MWWDKLQALYKTKGAPPLWVLNTTQGDKGDWPNNGNLFELTPFSHGSLRYPHQRTQPPYPIGDIATAVRASAAFADSQGLANEAQRSVMNTLAVLVPGARWGVKVKAINRMGAVEEVRLSDGGGADNLGLVSLVRRGLSDVIVVDAAQDAEGLMDDLCWAKVALREEGLTMAFDQLVKFDTNCGMRYPEKAVDKKPLKGMKDDMEGYNVSDWMNAVLHGTVRWPQTGRVTNLWLIKPAWRQTDVRKAYNGKQGTVQCGNGVGETDFNCFLLLYYGHNTSSTVSKSPDDFMAFPQHGTVAATLDSSSYLTLAYRELGRMLASRLQRDTLKKISIKGDHNCKQMPYATRKGRPGPSLQALTEKPTDCD